MLAYSTRAHLQVHQTGGYTVRRDLLLKPLPCHLSCNNKNNTQIHVGI